ncbi:hypothetical protein SAMN02910298_00804 [Pseudobutyrivibrio sp. YE44]|uniref:hypothetical protein n=1 Tax=Pseudobutyrivibrio sp. YE44 TaxID=1520802 RepID=UPI00088ECE5B|nr:hypothetical protein [Pseudobutyrivibrio sp. YE44]SDB15053.1 hypothetical protein SAMN02910298_00804 [Pseudobutyrivibrio sp. YE44]
MSIGTQLLDVPFADMVTSLGEAIANAQYALDQNSITLLKEMGVDGTVSLPFVSVSYNSSYDPNKLGDEENSNNPFSINDAPMLTSMIGAGFQPTFYQFAETIIEVKIAIKISREREYTRNRNSKRDVEDKTEKKRPVTRSTTVDATYSNKYNYSAEGSSLLRTRLVPVPPNQTISQLIDMRNKVMEKYFEIEIAKCQKSLDDATAALEKNQKEIVALVNENT